MESRGAELRLGLSPTSSREGQRRWGALQMHGGHTPISSNTWRATVRARQATFLGRLRAELGHGPKMMFAHLALLYIFPLKTKIIRAVD
jgi:hypothetical protein